MVKIPVYSNSRGRVPYRKQPRQSLSNADYFAAASQGRAIEYAGAQINNAAMAIGKAEEKREDDAARAWVLERGSELTLKISEYTNELKLTTGDLDYSSIDENDEQTYVNQGKAWLTKSLENERYIPPNKATKRYWTALTTKLSTEMIDNAIQYEAGEKIKSRIVQLNTTIENLAKSAYNDPYSKDSLLQNYQILLRTIDNPGTKEIEGYSGYLPVNMVKEFKENGEAKIAEMALRGTINQNPMEALRIIEDEKWGKKFHGINSDVIVELHNKARARANELILIEASNKARDIEDKFARMRADGTVPPGWSDRENIELYLTPSLETGKNNLTSKKKIRNQAEEILSKTNITVATYELTEALKYAPINEVVETLRVLPDSLKPGESFYKTAKKLFSNMGRDISKVFQGRSPAEIESIINNSINQVQADFKLRFNDRVEYLLHNDSVQAAFKLGDIPGINTLKALQKQMGFSPSEYILLTNSQAQSLVKQIKSDLTNPEIGSKILSNLEETYGDDWNSVWKQLTTMSGGLGPGYMFLGAINNSSGAPLTLQALKANPSELQKGLEIFKDEDHDKKLEIKVFKEINRLKINESVGASLNSRISMVTALQKILFNAAAILRISGQAKSNEEAVEQASEIIFKDVTFINEQEIKGMFTPNTRDINGNNLNTEVIVENANNLLDNVPELIKQYPGIVIPDSQNYAVSIDKSFRQSQYERFVGNFAHWTTSDDNTGLILIVPYAGGNTPIMSQVEGSEESEIFVLPWDKINKVIGE